MLKISCLGLYICLLFYTQCKSKSVSTRGVDPYTSECVGPDSIGVHDTYNQVHTYIYVP